MDTYRVDKKGAKGSQGHDLHGRRRMASTLQHIEDPDRQINRITYLGSVSSREETVASENINSQKCLRIMNSLLWSK